MKKHKIFLLFVFFVFSVATFAQTAKGKTFGLGAYIAENAYGGLGEYYFNAADWDLSFRLGVLKANSVRNWESDGWIGVGNFYLHMPLGVDWSSFRLGLGVLYQSFDWNTNLSSGTITDFTFNGGAGFDFKVADYLGIGIEGWLISDYETKVNINLEVERGNRYMNFVPVGTISFYF